MTSPRTFAAAECCNYRPNACLGVAWHWMPDGLAAPYILPTAEKPCIVGSQHHCKFFESAVLPAAPPQTKELYAASFANWRTPTPRLGSCGHPVPKGHRICPHCARSRQRHAKRTHYHNKKTPQKPAAPTKPPRLDKTTS